MSGPYADAADAYWNAGWRGILPLPAKAKKNPPSGFTGQSGVYPSYADIHAWAHGPERLGNIALRMPGNIIGIDVDAYGTKQGADTLAIAESMHGELPPTWRTTSRDDGISGIRLYRVPEGLAWPGEIGASTELIQTRHRYAVVWPSIHPEGRTYRWIGPDGIVSTAIPDPDDLPPLPQPWVEAYTGGEFAEATPRMAVKHADAVAWIAGQPHATETVCPRMEKAVEQFHRDLAGSAHNSTRDAVLRVARLAEEGHHGAVFALTEVRKAFIANATDPNRTMLGEHRRTHDEAVYEFGDLVAGGVGIVLASPTGLETCDCYGQLTALIAPQTDGTAALAPLTQPVAVTVDDTSPDPAPDGLKRMKDGASFILDAPEKVPSIWGDDDNCLWARGEACMIAGPPGVGKTTLTGSVLRGLLGLAQTALGLAVAPAERRVLYLAMDRPAQIARGLRRAFRETEREILADRLRCWEGPPPGDVARHPDVLLSLAHLADADTVIIDSVKDAAVGLTEDEVAAAYNRARQNCLANGVQVLELHHMVKRGVGGNKPTELADVYGSAWLTAGAGSVILLWGAAGDPIVEMRHLKQPASEVGPWRLIHDHDTGSTAIFHGTDILALVAAASEHGVTPTDVARQLFETEKPTESQKEKARRQLNKLVDQGHVERQDEVRDVWGGGKPQARFILPRSNHAAIFGEAQSRAHGPTTDQLDSRSNTNHKPNHANHAQGPTTPVPPSIEGDGAAPVKFQVQKVACGSCGRPTPKVTADTFAGNCGDCAKELGMFG